MTLESAERLVEKILQQLEVKYEVRRDHAGHQQDDHDHHHEDEPTIVVAPAALAQLPPEVRPFVTPATPEGEEPAGS